MIKDGQQIDYLDWNPLGTQLREGIKERGMDQYFIDNYEEESNAPAPGTPVSGYKFFIRTKDDKLLSPFAGISDILLFQMTPEQLKEYKKDMIAEEIDARYEAPIAKDSVAVDSTGRGGYYYYSNFDVLEDYMRAYMQNSGKEDINKLPRYMLLEDEKAKFGPIPYYKQLHADLVNKDIGGIPDPVRDLMRPGGGTYQSVEKTGGLTTTIDYTVKDLLNEIGNIEIYRVEGTAVENTFGDAGLIMNEMKVVGDPLVSIPFFEAAQRINQAKK